MGTINRTAWGIASVATLFLVSACRPDVSSLNVPLEYNPTVDNTHAAFILPAGAPTVFVASVDDRRDTQSNALGENRQRDRHVPIYATGMTPPEYVHRVIEQRLKTNGVQVVATQDQADRVLFVGLTEFEADESPNYHATVTLNVNVTDRSGATLAQGIISPGEASTFGGSLKPANYEKVISNATARAVDNLLEVAEFQHALSKNPTVLPAPGAMTPGSEKIVTVPATGPVPYIYGSPAPVDAGNSNENTNPLAAPMGDNGQQPNPQ